MNTHAFVRMSALLNTWTAEHEALTDTIKELKQQLLAAERRADEWEDRAKRALEQEADAKQELAEMTTKVEDLRKRIGEGMERDAQIVPFADAKKPIPDDINPDEEEARAAHRSKVEIGNGVTI